MCDRIHEDLRTALAKDPAATSALEVLLTYPGLHAVWLYRLAHRLHAGGSGLSARLLSHLTRWLTGIEIHPAATVGRRFFIDHGMGTVVGNPARPVTREEETTVDLTCEGVTGEVSADGGRPEE